ncbi:SRPBCC family protein [Cribrihabitans neustonicus]|uniref:SRPBCC family protein n=1 Tax=Cribrihabitans neustonicus TaxID=1429085 RepID=UPI003B5A14F6
MKPRLLTSRWRVPARIEDVSEVLGDVTRFPEWWGDVYLDVQILEAGSEDGVGRRVAFLTRGRLPYTLRWIGEVTEANRPHGWKIRASGDLEGQGIWRLVQEGETADIRYDWRVAVGKPVLRLLAPVLWPAFAANHRWAMARGLEGLRRELARRRS